MERTETPKFIVVINYRMTYDHAIDPSLPRRDFRNVYAESYWEAMVKAMKAVDNSKYPVFDVVLYEQTDAIEWSDNPNAVYYSNRMYFYPGSGWMPISTIGQRVNLKLEYKRCEPWFPDLAGYAKFLN